MKTVLLTGATGFIGRHCIEPLAAAGYEIHAVSSRPPSVGLQGGHWHRADLLDPIQVADLVAAVKPRDLLHLAWYAVPGSYWTSAENLRWLAASLELVRAFVNHGGQRAVGVGTCAEYDWRYGFCSEQFTPLSPGTLYGASKHALQTAVAAFARQFDLSAAWGRVFFLYGPFEPEPRLVPSVIRQLLNSAVAKCSEGNQIRDFLYVEDVAGALVRLLNSTVEGPVNISSGRPVSIRQVVETLAAAIGRPDLVQFGALPSPEGEPPLLVGDVRRLVDEVGWRPQVTLAEGLDRAIAWWRRAAAVPPA